MFVQFKHVDANETFYHLPSLLGVRYQKTNLGRGKVTGSNGVPYKGRALYRKFKPSDVVLIETKKTHFNAWMEVSHTVDYSLKTLAEKYCKDTESVFKKGKK